MRWRASRSSSGRWWPRRFRSLALIRKRRPRCLPDGGLWDDRSVRHLMEIRLPQLGEGADSGTVVSILVKEGDQGKKDQPVIELENEKAVASIPASASGTVTK